MNREFGRNVFQTSFVQDVEQGFAAVELQQIRNNTSIRVARVIFWDAGGQFFVETFDTEVPLEIIEDLIAEATKTIKAR
jgi:hypothetical protein